MEGRNNSDSISDLLKNDCILLNFLQGVHAEPNEPVEIMAHFDTSFNS